MTDRRSPVRAAALLTVLALGLLVSACGFRPMYGRVGNESIVQEFAGIEIPAQDARVAQRIRNSLLDHMTPRGQPDRPTYRLDMVPTVYIEGLGIQQDETITRFNIRIELAYKLTRVADQVVMTSGWTRALASFNRVDSEYATLSARKDAENRAAVQVAEDLQTRLAVFFDRQRSAAAQ
ncbi:LPS assembly lipoprotein LptE [Zavarzinia sp. CC-PAN008]|uniref:LPS assembly lipoprotein LptE n=1 Tax=Zavarzinia sp. CC-PAN008 TaxID=3243332 RepID=UPI003F749511